MTIYNILELIGGLALFLFGMHILGDSLTTISGGKMEQLLERLSSTKLKALLLGTVVTAVIQSSSATAVMVVALVNSGVMKLRHAVPIIMGANIGTTITGWILSLSGISGDSFFVQMLKPSTFTPVLAIVGVFLIFSGKTVGKKSIGNALLGFAVLMYGMSGMSASVLPLQSDPNFQSAFQVFTNPLLGVLVGALLTAVIQSSSAMTGILQALSTTGAMTFASTIPLIMGQNIGTCITAILSSIGAGKNAKRASFIHLTFNVIGTVIFMFLFYLINWVRPFNFYNSSVNEVGIAIVHTVFNVVTVAFLFPFIDQLVELSKRAIPAKEPSKKRDDLSKSLRLLDPRFLERPGFAVEQSFIVIQRMMDTATTVLHEAVGLIFDYSDEKYAKVEDLERQVDEYEDALLDYTIKITANSLNDADNEKLSIILHTINDVERISDYAMNIAEQAQIKAKSPTPFSQAAMDELKLFTSAVENITEKARYAMAELDVRMAFEMRPLEDRIDQINRDLSDTHIIRLQKGICRIENGINIVEMYNHLERIADHCYNISTTVLDFVAHFVDKDNPEVRYDRSHPRYAELMEYYEQKYRLPDTEEDPSELACDIPELSVE